MDAIEDGKRQGKGVISLRGKMIDAPIVKRAQQVLEMEKGDLWGCMQMSKLISSVRKPLKNRIKRWHDNFLSSSHEKWRFCSEYGSGTGSRNGH